MTTKTMKKVPTEAQELWLEIDRLTKQYMVVRLEEGAKLIDIEGEVVLAVREAILWQG